jgi:signal transduction histidine kinase
MSAVDFIRRSVKRKTMAIVLVTALVALVANALALLIYDIRTFREAELDDIRSQAQVLARVAAPALAFNDRKEARAGLATLKSRPDLLAAAVYGGDGKLFASFEPRPDSRALLPDAAPPDGVSARIDFLHASVPVIETGQRLGSVYLVTRYGLRDRVLAYAGILAAVVAIGLGAALLISSWLQRVLTKPIVDIEAAARRVVEQRDFGVRAPRTTDDEIGVLADAFNRMLEEVERRTAALEAEMQERRQAETALRVADRRKDEFLATLAHELRNPLAPITNSVQILKLKGPSDPELVWARDIVDRQVRHMARLLEDLLDVGRITSGKLRLRKGRVRLAAVIDAAMETSRPVVAAGRHELSVQLPQEAVWLDADAVRLAQVFSNLVNNAAKYTEPGGRIALSAEVQGAQVRIAVKDNGIGVGADALPRLFEMFSQAAPALERAQGGLGIGLFLVRSLVELHGGTVSASSAGSGKGSEFVVLLPRVPPSAASDTPAAPLPVADGRRKRVLVADDNADVADTMAVLLRHCGYEVDVAHDGIEAFTAAARAKPDVALLDIGMPRMSGYELARRIRAEPWGRNLPLIAVTGWGQEEDKRNALEAGFQYHLTKPVDAIELEQLLARLLA